MTRLMRVSAPVRYAGLGNNGSCRSTTFLLDIFLLGARRLSLIRSLAVTFSMEFQPMRLVIFIIISDLFTARREYLALICNQ